MKTIKIKIEIHSEKDYSWCEVNGHFLFGRNEDEIRETLDMMNSFDLLNEYDF